MTLAGAPIAATAPSAPPPSVARVNENYGKLPLAFEANRGQTDPKVKFLSRGPGYGLFLTSSEAVLALRHAKSKDQKTKGHANDPRMQGTDSAQQSGSVLRLKLVGANAEDNVNGLDPLPGKSNYFIGNNPKKWRTNVPNYAKVKYQDVYPGVDLIYYGNQQQLEYDWVVGPGADPSAIRLAIEGAQKIRIDSHGDLVIQTGEGEVRFQKPVVYQEQSTLDGSQLTVQHGNRNVTDNPKSKNQNRKFLDGRYVLRGKHDIGLEVASYDHSKPLVIDPVLSYSTYLGGSNSDTGSGIAVDSAGNVYVSGTTNSTDFPTASPFQAALGGTNNAFVTKLNSAGSALVYSTYLGGNGIDHGNAIAVDSAGNAYVTGQTSSTNFPTANPIQAALAGGADAFVTKLNATGNVLTYSTYLGGSGSEEGLGIAVDSAGSAYVTGDTDSTNFPTTASPIQATCGGCPAAGDAFVTKLNAAGSALVYSTYLGGSGNETGFGIAVDSAGNAYVTGGTQSTDFPTSSPFQAASGGAQDAFVAKLNAAGSALVYSTYLGGSNGDEGLGIAVDSTGNAYVTGFTSSPNFPTASPLQPNSGGGAADAFVTKLNAAGSALVYSTYLGGSGSDVGFGIAVDSTGSAYVAGQTTSSNFPLANPIQAACGNCSGGGDTAFIANLNTAGGALTYSTYLGGNFNDFAEGIAVDSAGNAYVTGATLSTNFPTVNAFQIALGGTQDAFVAKISQANAPGVSLKPLSLTFAPQTVSTTSAAQTVTLQNVGSAPLTTSIVASGDFAETDTCGTGIAGGTSCTISVKFTPTAPGVRSGAITITDNAAGSPHMVSLSGTGVGVPLASLSPSSLLFGPQGVGIRSAGQNLTLSNTGTGTLTITSIGTTGDFAQTNDCGGLVVAASSCTITVTFTPTITGPRTGALTVTDDSNGAPGSTQMSTLSGTGTPAPNPVPQINQPLVPDNIVPGGAGFTLTVNGTGFVSGATIEWNGGPRTTTFVSGKQLTATINAADIILEKTAAVTVVNPPPGGGASNVIFFTITNPVAAVSFAGSAVLFAGGPPQAVAVGDFNGDGKPDLAVASLSDVNPLAILLGNGDGTFTSAASPVTGSAPVYVAVGDFNDDGRLDLAVINSGDSTVSIFLGNGDGTFQPKVDHSAGGEPAQIAVGDFNGDGKLDLVVVSKGFASASILLGNGDGTFYSGASYSGFGECPSGVAVGDFNSDGKLDLAVGDDCQSQVRILLGIGDGTFSAPVGYSTGNSPAALATGDFNGDGKLDLATVNHSDNTVSILLGNGDGTFPTHVEFPTGSQPAAVVLGDFNGDGKLDLAATNRGDDTVSVLLGNGNGTFQPQQTSDTGLTPGAMAVGDFNGDGGLDLAVANTGDSSVSILLQPSGVNVAPSFLNFGNQVVNTASTPQVVTLSNNQDVPLKISSITVSAGYTETNTCGTLPASLPQGSACRISVTFAPTTFGTQYGTLTISDNFGGSPNPSPQTVSLVGTGVSSGAVTLSPLSLSFGNQQIGTASAPQAVTLTNTGTGPLGISSISVASGQMNFMETNNCPPSLAAGAFCTINVTFTPTTVGSLFDELTIQDDAPGNPHFVLLSGNGVGPSFNPPELFFNPQVVGTQSAPQSTILTNTGSLPLLIDIIAATGDFLQQGNTCPASLAPSASCIITVTFNPTATGFRTGNIVVTDNAMPSPQMVPLFGTGISSGIAMFTPTSLAFGSQNVGTSATQTLTLTNTGTGPLGNFNISINEGNESFTIFDYAQTNTCSSPLAPGATCTVSVTFTPVRLGALPAQLIETDDSGQPRQSIALTGTGAPVPFAVGELFLSTGFEFVQRRSNTTGALIQLLDAGVSTQPSGLAFDKAGNLDVTDFNANTASKFNNTGVLLGTFGSGYDSDPESIVFDLSGNAYVGQADGSQQILKFDPSGNLLATFAPATEARGTDWLDLAQDQCTMFYTSEGTSVKRFNVCTGTQLPDFATGLTGPLFALRIRPDGGLLVADSLDVKRLDANGNVIQTYTGLGVGSLFALNLDRDGTSFWTADLFSTDVYKVDIASGNILFQFNAGTSTLAGLAINGEGLAATSADLVLTKTGSPNPVNVGANLTYALSATNKGPQSATNVTVTDTLPVGVTFVSATPSAGTCTGTATVTCNVGTLANAGTATVTIVVTPTASGTITNTATVIADQSDPNPANNTATVSTTVGGPLVSLTPPSLSFGNQQVNTPSMTRMVTLTNTGSSNLIISNIVSSTDYTLGGNCPIDAPLAPASSCNIAVTFTPTVIGPEPGTVTITDNAPDSPQTIYLSGMGVSAGIPTLSSTTLTFGNQNVGTTSAAKSLTLTNTGTGPLGKISFQESEGSFTILDFSQTNNCPVSPNTLAPGAFCTINVTFNPFRLGALSAQITETDDSGQSGQTVALTGTGAPVPFVDGELFLGVGGGQVQRRSNAGALIQIMSSGTGSDTTGMAFDQAGNLYSTNFQSNEIFKFDNTGVPLGTFGPGGWGSNESMLFDKSGNAFVGVADGTNQILKLDSTGNILAQFAVAHDRGGDWIDLAADQCTVYYDGEGSTVRRYDTCKSVQLADFASGLAGAYAFALRIRPNGEVLVADTSIVVRLDSNGKVIQTYSGLGTYAFALNLDRDGTSFWTADISSTDVYKVDIATGNVLVHFNAGTTEVAGLTVKGEIQAATAADLSLTKTGAPNPVMLGGNLTYTLTATNNGPNSATNVIVTDTLPIGVTFVSATPSAGTCTGNATVTCNVGTLANAGTANVTIVVTPTAAGTITNTANVIADQTDPNPANNTATVITTVANSTQLTLSTRSLQLPGTHINQKCQPGTVTVTNTGIGNVTISGVTITGAFSQTNTCSLPLPPGSSCAVTVTFEPKSEGQQSGTLTITSNAPSSPDTVALSGDGLPQCLLSPNQPASSVIFGTDTTTFTVSHKVCNAVGPVQLSCTNQSPATCSFSPGIITVGEASTLTVSNLKALSNEGLKFVVHGDAALEHLTTGLSVQVMDFIMTSAPNTATVSAGQSASYAMAMVPQNGLQGTVSLDCSGAPTGATCSVLPQTVTLNGTAPVNLTVTVSTTARSLVGPRGARRVLPPGGSPVGLILLALIGLGTGLLAWTLAGSEARHLGVRARLATLATGLIVATVITWTACGGGSMSPPSSMTNGTPAGTYNLSVTGTYNASGALQLTHSTTVQLTVH